jgi:hypothetical protein
MLKVKHNDLPAPKGASGVGVAVPLAMAPARASRGSTIGWGLLGFFCGALFWHVVGFWDFLGGIVYKRQQHTTIIERVLTTQFSEAEEDKPLAVREQHARAAAQNCTTLVMDRITGATAARPCVVIIRNVRQDADLANAAHVLPTSARLDRVASGR